jgi:hypothetical protein
MSMHTKLSTLWIFVTLNTIYCDVTGFQDSDVLKQYLAGNLGGLQMTQGFCSQARSTWRSKFPWSSCPGYWGTARTAGRTSQRAPSCLSCRWRPCPWDLG